jgi:ABC-type sulfate transport system substrate-binding protein
MALGTWLGFTRFAGAATAAEPLNVSYDPTRELYSE